MTAVMATFASLPLPIRGVAAHAQSQGSNVEAERGRLACGRVARRPGRAPQGRGPRPLRAEWSDTLPIADNKLALNAGWDNLAICRALGFDLALTGFTLPEIGFVIAERTAGLTDPDDAPEPLGRPVTALGDVWILGAHRLVCGDSTKPWPLTPRSAGSSPISRSPTRPTG